MKLEDFECANGDLPDELVAATQKALINSMKKFIGNIKTEINQPGLTWEQIEFVLDNFGDKKPIIVNQSEPM